MSYINAAFHFIGTENHWTTGQNQRPDAESAHAQAGRAGSQTRPSGSGFTRSGILMPSSSTDIPTAQHS